MGLPYFACVYAYKFTRCFHDSDNVHCLTACWMQILLRSCASDCWLSGTFPVMFMVTQKASGRGWATPSGSTIHCPPCLFGISAFEFFSTPLQFYPSIRKFCLFKMRLFCSTICYSSAHNIHYPEVLLWFLFCMCMSPFVAKCKSQLQTKCLCVLMLIQVSRALGS